VRRCSTADANITRPRGDARPAKVSTLSMSIVLPVALPEFEFGIAEQRRKAKTEAERSMDHGHMLRCGEQKYDATLCSGDSRVIRSGYRLSPHEHANGLTKHCRVEHTCTPAHLVSSVHTTSKVLYAQRLGSSYLSGAAAGVDWPLNIVPYHSSRHVQTGLTTQVFHLGQLVHEHCLGWPHGPGH
jgi:hypothetical protein